MREDTKEEERRLVLMVHRHCFSMALGGDEGPAATNWVVIDSYAAVDSGVRQALTAL